MANDLDRAIRDAILQKRLVRFMLHGRPRVAEPHDYGLRARVPQLLVYQVGGESGSGRLPGWRWAKLADISELKILDEKFPGGRPAPSGRHARWDELYLRVESADS